MVEGASGATDADCRFAAARLRPANAQDVELRGEGWLRSLVDLAERGGLGHVERDQRGEVVFVFASPLPDAETAWEVAFAAGDDGHTAAADTEA